MADSPTKVEAFGVEHIPDDSRHGRPNRTFTLWFAANLTIADYAIGVLTTTVFGLTAAEAITVLALGNLLGGAFLGLSAAMGPSLGFPQMFSSRASFGRKGNYPLGAMNWVSTIGWFTVNTILGSEALEAALNNRGLPYLANFTVIAALLVVVQVVVAVYGHDFIQLFERVMSIVLGVLFFLVFLLTATHLAQIFEANTAATPGVSFGELGAVFAISFSYIMSWSPYASDYSRYLPVSTSRRRVALYALAGGALASFAVEVIGAFVGAYNQVPGIAGLLGLSFQYGWVGMVAIVLGGMAANILNIYTNALSGLVLDLKAKRTTMVLAGGAVGLVLALAFGQTFESFFENFLLVLDYWITPWLAIVLVDFYLTRRGSAASVEGAPGFDFSALGVYALSIVLSVPFMVPPTSPGFPVGALSGWFGGADFSYFISFAIAALLTLLIRANGSWTGSAKRQPG